MSLSLILNTATSGMQTAQTQLRVVSDNVANVNTPGYVRKLADQVAVTTQGVGAGADIARVRLATDRFLQAASLNASAESAREGVRYELYDRIQALFGDPGATTGFFNEIDAAFAAFAATSEDPTSAPRRQDALFKAQGVFEDARRISDQIQAVRQDADARIKGGVDTINALVKQIHDLNVEIARSAVVSGDASGAQGAQAALIDQLGQLVDIQISPKDLGGVTIRTGTGAVLVGEGHAVLDYARAGTLNAETAFDEIWITEPQGMRRSFSDDLGSGEMKGLLELRDVEAPQTVERLGELMTRMADELNRVHNAHTSTPPPQVMSGKNMGQDLTNALAGFTGATSILITNAQGVVQARADITFPADPATFIADVNAQLGASGSISFVDGKLSITAAAGLGVAVVDDPANPSGKQGRAFAHHFGLNDLVVSERPTLFDTGLTPASNHGFTAGETIKFRFFDPNGARVRDIQVAIPPGGTMASLLAGLNDPVTGIGRFGSFALDAQGALSFTANPGQNLTLGVLEDTSTQVPSGVSFSELFGVGSGVRASRADAFSLRADIERDPKFLALSEINHGAAVGGAAYVAGDGRGGQKLADAGQINAAFERAGGAAGGSISVSRYASELSGDIGGKAASAKSRSEAAQTLFQEAKSRQLSQEGVNLDEELVNLTTYQQAFNASARMIQAARELYDTLLGMV